MRIFTYALIGLALTSTVSGAPALAQSALPLPPLQPAMDETTVEQYLKAMNDHGEDRVEMTYFMVF